MGRAVPLAGAAAAARGDDRDWPGTTRVLPWLTAGFVVMLFTVPIDSVALGVPLPFDPRPDRFLLLACFTAWMLVAAVRPRGDARRAGLRLGAFDTLLVLLALAAVASVALNLPALQRLGEASVASKQLVLLLSYLAFYFFVAGTVRRSEVPAFVRLVIGLAVLAALLTIVEYFTRENVFYTVTAALSPPGTEVPPDAGVVVAGGRPDVTGPARHGLAVSAMLAMTLPFALASAARAPDRGGRLLFGIAAAVILLGGLATVRRAGVVLPFVAVSVLLAFGGRRMLPVVAVTAAILAAVPVVAPGAFREVVAQFSGGNVGAQQSIEGRTADYSEVVPDIRAHALTGRGFGSYIAQRYRFLDNQYILVTVEMGVVGLALYVATMLAGGAGALRLGLSRGDPAAWIGLAGAGAALAYLAANALFDALAFPQAPYTFLLIMALVGLSRRGPTREGAA